MKVEIKKMDRIIQPWFLVLVGDNEEPIAVTEGYFSKWNAKRAANKNFPGIEIVDTTLKPYKHFGP